MAKVSANSIWYLGPNTTEVERVALLIPVLLLSLKNSKHASNAKFNTKSVYVQKMKLNDFAGC